MKIKKMVSVFLTFSFLVEPSVASEFLSYSGRITNTAGVPVPGPVNLKIELAYTNGAGIGSILCSKTYSNTPLMLGVFHLKLDLSNTDCGGESLTKVLSDTPVGESIAIRVTDETHNKQYSHQAIYSVPYALISKTAENLDSMGATPGQVLGWNGVSWAPTSAGGGGSVTSITTGAGLIGGPITSTGSISLADGGVTSQKINQMGASTGQVLKWSGTSWLPSADNGVGVESDPTVQGYAKFAPIGGSCIGDQALRFDALLNSGSGGLYCASVSIDSDSITEGSSNLFFTDSRAQAAAVSNSLSNGVTDMAPSEDTVFDALALKQNNLGSSSDVHVRTLGVGTSSPGAALGVASTLNASTSVIEYGLRLNPTITQSSGAGYTALLVNATDSASTGTGPRKLIDLQVGGVSKFSVDNNGAVVSSTATSGTSANYTSASGNQLTVGFDSTNRTTLNVDSLGFTTFNANGSGGQGFNFSGGNVGIGAPVPGEALDVTGSVRASIGVKAPLLSNLTDLSLTADSDNNTSGALIFNTGATERMRILNNGNVGIGMTSPAAKLDIQGSASQMQLAVRSHTTQGPYLAGFFSTSGQTALGISHNGSIERPAAISGDLVISNAGTNNVTIHTNGSERLRVSGSGNIGINTSSPNYRTHISGPTSGGAFLGLTPTTVGSGDILIFAQTPAVTGSVNIFNMSANATSSALATISNSNTTSSTADARLNLRVQNDSTGDPTTTYTVSGALDWTMGVDNSDNNKFKISGSSTLGSSDRVTIDTLGRVGIGETAPNSLLQVGNNVTGSIRLDPLRVSLWYSQTDNFPRIEMAQNLAGGPGGPGGPGISMAPSGYPFATHGSALGNPDIYTGNVLGFYISDGTKLTERMRVHSNGRVGIGTSTPSELLHVAGNAVINNVTISDTGGSNARIVYANTGSIDAVGGFLLRNGAGTVSYMDVNRTSTGNILFPVGNVGIGMSTFPSEKLHVAGNILATGTITPSDQNLKTQIKPISNSLNKITSLRGVEYKWKDVKKYGNSKQIGVIAQDVKKVFPEAVKQTGEGFLAVSYQVLVAPLIESVKEIVAQMTETDKRVEALEKENLQLKQSLCKKDPTYDFCR